jgi:preprotein translocase subunit SecA
MPLLIPLLGRFGESRRQAPTRHDRELVRAIRRAGEALKPESDRQLRNLTDQLRECVASGDPLSSPDVLVPAFALAGEAARRTLGITYYDVQLLGGLALARGSVAELQTGEGKTFVAALPALLHALDGRGVHVITSNAYLAQRDCELMTPLYETLGVSVGSLKERAQPHEKRAAYACDITYGPGYDFGFDYLRDHAALRRNEEARLGETLLERLRGERDAEQQRVQRGLACAIVDEVDHVLIEDASSPLIISEPTSKTAVDAEAHHVARSMIARLTEGEEYRCDAATGLVQLTEQGTETVHRDGDAVPWKVLLRPWSDYIEQALRVNLYFRRDVHYVVEEGEVRVVDESTGRIFADRSWRDGLHQAVEAKEGVDISSEKRPLARITRQRLFRLYDRLCGMTGTATDSAGEFSEFYGLRVVVIPLWKPSRRTVRPSRCFTDADGKWSAVVDEIRRIHHAGRPVLVGTRTIADSEALAERLRDRGVPHQVLNGKQDEDEAEIVARAGQAGAVTIATNMAGRGTDIKLGPGVAQRGGLHVIGTQRHSSRRIDRQLVGRSARQGDPGSAQFFLSADDELLAKYRPWLSRAMKRAGAASGEVPSDFDFAICKTQRSAEKAGLIQRRQLFHSDQQRDTVMAKMAGEEEARS